MKKATLLGTFGVASLLLFTACDESLPGEKGFGTISPLVDFDPSVVASRSSRAASEIGDVTIHDLSLTLTSEDGSFSETYPYDNFPSDKGFPIGNYTLTASYGDAEAEGFELPSVGGSCDLTVLEGRAAKPTLAAELNKAMVAIRFDENLVDYMKSCSARLHSAGGTYVDYATDETRAAYLKPGNVTINLDFVKPNGMGGNLEVANFTAEAKHRYTMTITLGGDGFGTVDGITIKYDDALEQEEVTIDISDETLTTPAPELTYTGFSPDETVTIVEGTTSAAVQPVFNVKALGKIAKAVLTTKCNSLTEAGWPAEVDLVSASPATLEAMNALGLKAMGLSGNTDVFGRLDLTNVITHIAPTGSAAAASTFTLVVTDASGKSTEPVTFSVKVERLELAIAYDGTYEGQSTIDLDVTYNGTDPQNNIKVEYLSTNGTFKPTTIAAVKSRAAYVLTVNIPSDAKAPLTLQAKVGTLTTEELAIATAPIMTANANDTFATSAWVALSSDEYNCATKTIELYGSTDGGNNYTKLTGAQSGAEYHITGLTPATTYKLRAKVGGVDSRVITLTTEAATQLQNGNMDNGWSKGEHKNSAAACDLWTLPNPWSSNNPTTTGWLNTTNKYSGLSAVSQTTDATSGSSAALIRTVAGCGWSAVTSKTEIYAAGEMTLNVSHASRPSALNFNCKYTEYISGEKGVIQVSLLDASGHTIASGNKEIGNQGSYTAVSIPLTYSRGAAKAASISVKFLSTNQTNLGSSCATNKAGQYNYGAALYIDDVELAY